MIHAKLAGVTVCGKPGEMIDLMKRIRAENPAKIEEITCPVCSWACIHQGYIAVDTQ